MPFGTYLLNWLMLLSGLPLVVVCYLCFDNKWHFAICSLTAVSALYLGAKGILRPLVRHLVKTDAQIQEQIAELRDIRQIMYTRKHDTHKKNSEIQAAHQLIAEKAAALERANQYKSEFLANMSHELRTPLNSIMLLSRYLLQNKEGALSTDHLESLSSIYTASLDLLTLINDILDLSKVEAGKMEINPEELLLEAFAESIIHKFKPLTNDKNLSLNRSISTSVPTAIQTDPNRLEQIIKNFMSNAIKFTAQGSVSLLIGDGNDLKRQITALKLPLAPEQYIVFSVKDTGIGVAPEKHHLIFEAFQQADGTTNRQYGGTGLGLSISKKLTEMLGGIILLEDNDPHGSIFHLILPKRFPHPQTPMMPPEAEPAQNISPPVTNHHGAPSKASAKKRFGPIEDDRHTLTQQDRSILIIEDEVTYAERLIAFTQNHQFKFILTENGQTGLQLAEYYQPSAIIIDLNHSKLARWSVMTRLKDNRLTRHIPVCMIAEEVRELEAIKMGAMHFLVHPIEEHRLHRLFDKIEHHLSKTIRDLLLVEDDPLQQKSITKIISNPDVHITIANTAAEALEHMSKVSFDCMVLDLGLPDMSGVDLLEKIRNNKIMQRIPIIIYTGRNLNYKEIALIDEYAQSTIIKSANSHTKLLNETTLFLHRDERHLSPAQQNMLRKLHDRKSILTNKKVLIIDDDMRNVFSIKKTLEDEGMKVMASKNGLNGLATLDKHPDIDIIIMDILMPEMDGYATMSTIRQETRFQKLPIIALTAKAMKGDRAKCIEAGANDYLTKPVDADRLFSMLRVWLYA